ncbi:MAG: S41 family peptidase, partial [Elusimicrobiota bacterium]
MKKILSLITALLLAPGISAAELLIPSYNGMRSITPAGGVKPAAVMPVKYRTEQNPGYVDPDSAAPPNLRQLQVVGLMERMVQLEEKKRGITDGEVARGGIGGMLDLRAPNKRLKLSESHLNRLINRLAQVDRNFVDPISTRRWTEIVGELDKIAETELDASAANWDEVVDKMLKKAVREQKDIHSSYMNPAEVKEFMEMMQGSFSGIGASMKLEEGKGAKVEIVFPDSPAEKAGVKNGDIVTAVDGVPAGDKDLGEIIKRIKGVEGTAVKLSIERGGVQIRPITVTRGQVQMANVYSKMLTPSIGYVYFSEFRGDTDQEVFKHVKQLKQAGMKSLVIDVRGNPGGRVTAVASIASEFLRDGDPIVTFKKQGVWQSREVTDGDGMFVDIPVAVLINGGSASASEILAGAMQDHVDAPIIIGTRSYGKGTAQSITPGPSGRALKLTGSRWHTPHDRTIDADKDPATGAKIEGTGGVVPDIDVEVTPEQAGRIMQDIYRELNGGDVAEPAPDPQLKKAIEVLGGG